MKNVKKVDQSGDYFNGMEWSDYQQVNALTYRMWNLRCG